MIKRLITKTNSLVLLILILAAFIRLYRISSFLTFLGDEGRDVLVVYNILHGHFTLLGPTSSVGGFFLGPFYYYLMAPFLWIFNYNPVGPAVMIALFGVLTVWFVYYIGKEFFGTLAGIIAATLYAISPLVVQYSKSSWNPNMMPLTTLLMMYTLYKAVIRRSIGLFAIVGVLYGIALQLHYIEVFIGPVMVLFVFISIVFVNHYTKHSNKWYQLVKGYAAMLIGFLVGFFPFLLFEARHGFQNIKNIYIFVFHSKETGAGGQYIATVWDVFYRIFGRLITAFPVTTDFKKYSFPTLELWEFATIILALGCIIVLCKHKNKLQVLLLGTWLFVSILLFGFYKKPIYDYYFEFLFPLPFLLVGNALSLLSRSLPIRHTGKILACCAFLVLVIVNLYFVNPFTYAYNNQKEQTKQIADLVLSKTDNKPFNFALITGGNSDHAYRYFMTIEGHPPVTIENPAVDPKRTTVTNQLMVVCESLPCYPLGWSLWEVAGFGQADIAGEWDVSVVKVYRLVHHKEKK